jgi:hypothetical protein
MDSNALFLKVYKGDSIPKICIWGNDEYEKKCSYTGEMKAQYILNYLSKSKSLKSRDIARYIMDYDYATFEKYINLVASDDTINRDIMYVKPYISGKYKCSVIFESLHTAVNTYIRIEPESGNDYSDVRVSWIPKENFRHVYGNVNTTIEDDIGKNINEFSKDLNSKIHNNIYSTVDLKFIKDLVKFIIDKFNELDVLNFSEDAKIIILFHDDIENY